MSVGRRRAPSERGAAAVEGALVICFLLIPLVMGILTYGNYFWQRQRVAPVDLEINTASIYGHLTCTQLVSRVTSLVNSTLTNAGVALTGTPLVDVSVLQRLTLGVDVAVSVELPLVSGVASLVPLPDGGALVEDLVLRLENVTVDTGGSC